MLVKYEVQIMKFLVAYCMCFFRLVDSSLEGMSWPPWLGLEIGLG